MSLLNDGGFLPHMKPLSMKRSTVISILDVGTSKVCCLIAKLTPRQESDILPGRTHKVEVIGIGHQRSRGIKSGVITDLVLAEQSIRVAVDTAERMAGITVESLIVNVSAGRLFSEAFSADIDINGHEISKRDISHVLGAGASHALAPDRSVVHSLPIGYTLDGEQGILDPRGMIGSKLGVDMHILTAENAPLRNLELCINRCHLSIAAMVATPYASGLAAMVDDEAEMGSACIDMGGGTTTLSVFLNGRFIYCDAIAVGGNHVTMDIARGLSMKIDDAERLKVLHGSVLSGNDNSEELIGIPCINDQEGDVASQISRNQLTRIIHPRIEETLEMVRDRLARSGFADAVGKRVVLTGGASQLTGVGELSRRIMSKNVRIGRPMGIAGMPAAAKGPAFSTAVGLMVYPQISQIEFLTSGNMRQERKMTGTDGSYSRFSHNGILGWLKESF